MNRRKQYFTINLNIITVNQPHCSLVTANQEYITHVKDGPSYTCSDQKNYQQYQVKYYSYLEVLFSVACVCNLVTLFINMVT